MTLPQRKVRYYEALSRLRSEEGDIIPAGDFIEVAEAVGLMPKIDNMLVFRCVQVTRRLQLKSRDVGLFCNISASTLTDAVYFKQFLDFMDANRALSNALMFEFTQDAYRNFGPIEYEGLAALAERGFRFSMDHVADLRMEPKELADRSFRFLKVSAKLLLNRAANAQNDIHPEDLADLLARAGIDLIAERIESESMVVDLLDYDVRFGQGFLFSPPRPVRQDALHGVSGRGEGVARERAVGDDSPAECERIRRECPECEVICLPEKPYLIPRVLNASFGIENIRLTEEDRKKGEMYRAQAVREQFQKGFDNLDDFLKSLEIEVQIRAGFILRVSRVRADAPDC